MATANSEENGAAPKTKKLTKAQQADLIARFDSILDAEMAHAKVYANFGKGASEEEKKAARESVVGPGPRVKADGSPANIKPEDLKRFEAFDRAQSVVDLGMRFDKTSETKAEVYKPALMFLVNQKMGERLAARLANPEAKEPKLSLQERFYLHHVKAIDTSGTRKTEGKGMRYFTIDELKENVRKKPESADVAVKALEATIGETRRALGDMARDNMRERAKAKEAAGQER